MTQKHNVAIVKKMAEATFPRDFDVEAQRKREYCDQKTPKDLPMTGGCLGVFVSVNLFQSPWALSPAYEHVSETNKIYVSIPFRVLGL